MCLILIGIDPRPGSRVLLLANRDEFHARASAPIAAWVEDGGVVGGRDLVAGGSWLAVRRDGSFAAVTNVRNGPPKPAPRSRGDLVRNYVLGTDTAADYLAALRPNISLYAPFNLVLGDASGVVLFDGSTRETRRLETGLHTVSNGPVERPWPKMSRLEHLVADELGHVTAADSLLAVLRDRHVAADKDLPDTGLDLARERLLSSIFIDGNGSGYGTRASTLLEISGDGQLDVIEVGFGPNAAPTARRHWRYQPNSQAWRPVP